MTKDEIKNRISMALKDFVLQQGFEIICKENTELEKENAELKEQCLIRADCNTCNSTCKTENIEMKKQLTKAKEIIKKLLDVIHRKNVVLQMYENGVYSDLIEWSEVIEEVEQFFK